MTNSNQLDFHEPTLQQVADLCSQFGFTCAGEADLACLRAMLREGFSRYGHQPAPPAEGEVAELVEWLRDAAFDLNGSDPAKSMLTRAADLLSIAYATGPEVWEPIPLLPAQRHPTPVPGGMIPVEYWDIDSGARIVTEPSEEGPGGCWVVLNSRHVNPLTEFPTAKAAWDALQQAHALPLPQGEVE